MKINRNEFVTAFSFALDFLEISIRENITNHNKRVCLISVWIGEALGLDAPSLFDLYAYAMFHDNGITHEIYNTVLVYGNDGLEAAAAHCIKGESNLADFPFLQKRENIIKYHHEAYDGSGFFGIQGDSIPLFSQIIALANMVEILYRSTAEKKEIIATIKSLNGTKYAPVVCEAFFSIAKNVSFWILLDDMFIGNEIQKRVPMYGVDLQLYELLPITGILSRIIDEKSPFTGLHSTGLSQKAGIMADYYGFDKEKKTKFIIAADLHDTGKLVVSNAIIDKNGKLTADEFEVIKTHTFYTRKVLESLKGFEDITEWASNHHEKLDGTGYPYGLSKAELSFESQLMACLDIYQALTEERPYREGLSHTDATKIMMDMANKHAINENIVSDITEYCGKVV